MEKQTTAQRLQYIMKERNLKQMDILQLAQPYCSKYRIKLGKSDLSQFVNGKVEPGQWKLSILAMALNVSELWLMGFDVPMKREEEHFELPPAQVEVPSPTLSPDETELLTIYRSLNADGKNLALNTVKSLAFNPAMLKDGDAATAI